MELDFLDEQKKENNNKPPPPSAPKTEPLAGRKIKRRKSRSLDRKRSRHENVISASSSSEGEETAEDANQAATNHSQIIESVDCVDSSQELQTVTITAVDSVATVLEVHQQRSNEIVSEMETTTTTVDINHNDSEVNKNECVRMIPCKVFNPISDSSSWDESDDNVGNYALVELRNKVNSIIVCYIFCYRRAAERKFMVFHCPKMSRILFYILLIDKK